MAIDATQPYDDQNIFAKILRGEIPNQTVFENEFACNNIFLHANSIQFTHPISNTDLFLKAPLPNDWNKIIKLFNLPTLFISSILLFDKLRLG